MNDSQTPQFNPKELITLYLSQNYDQLSEKLIQILEHFENVTYVQLSINARYFINAFIKNFLYLFTQPDYFISDRYVVKFIQLNPLIANLVAISCFKTTDYYLEILRDQEKNFAKILTLYSARNTVKFDYEILFNAHPQFACLWYSIFLETYRSVLANKEAYQNLKNHITYQDEKLTDFYNISDIYFSSTYIDGYRDREIKGRINQSVQNNPLYKNLIITNNPNPKKIAIITCLWYPQHSVYRTFAGWLESLKNHYELTLFHLGSPNPNLDTHLFKEVIYLENQNGSLNLSALQNNDFMTIFYPDVGMSAESIILANLRLAPIQICGVGHSVSTWGSKIDYYFSGADVEISESPENNYSERLVLLPGYGIINEPVNYTIQNLTKTRPEFIINCSWFSQKVNYQMLCILGKIIQKSKRKILFRFFSGGIEALLRKNGYLPFVKDLEDSLGKDNFEVIPGKAYPEYMALMEEGDLCIDAYHFGGCNTIADSLYLRKPTVTFEGKKWYNRIGSQMLRSIGLEELIATNSQEYLHLVLKLIHQDQYRLRIQEKLQEIDLDQTIFNRENQIYFKNAIDYLVTNHKQLQREQSRQPIFIS